MSKIILQLQHVSFSFRTYGGVVKAVRDVSFDVKEGEILGIVGESGCGKSVTAQSILKLNPQSVGYFESGSIYYKDNDIVPMTETQMRNIRGAEIGFIFQDPMTSLNPTMTIGKQIKELFIDRNFCSKSEIQERTIEMLKKVGISDPIRRLRQYPHELSGGMKQRVMIAMALVSKPSIIIADEPTTSLDVTIEAQILQLLKDLSRDLHVSVIIITHDMGVIAKICDRILVMYGGKVVEKGTTDDIFYHTGHPYTRGLLSSIPKIDMEKTEKLIPIDGTPPDLFSPPKGCPYAARCVCCMEICNEQMPDSAVLNIQHDSCCWLHHPFAPHVNLIEQHQTKEPIQAERSDI